MSLFGIISDQMYSAAGRQKMLEWMQKPLSSRDALTARMDAVQYLLNPSKEYVIADLAQGLRCVKNVRPILKRLADAKFKMADWNTLQQTLNACQAVISVFRQQNGIGRLHFFSEMVALDGNQLGALLDSITKTVDFQKSKEANTFTLKTGVCPDVDYHTELYAGLSDFLSEVSREEMDIYTSIDSLSVVYLPTHGFYLCLPRHVEQLSYVSAQHAEIEYIFETDEFAYCKTPRMRELDVEIGDIHGMIRDKVLSVEMQLAEFVIESHDVLCEAVEAVAEVDCICGLANIARENEWRAPRLVDEPGLIQIKGGRHPLVEADMLEPFVPNDISICRRDGKVHIVTGPNASGKSVFIAQVGLIAFLAHIGSFVPAEAAIVGRIDAIHTRIHSIETAAVQQSLFVIDLNQISGMLQNSSEASLLLIDEFGKGTEAVGGAALLGGTIQHLLERADRTPCTLVTTHALELLEQEILESSASLKVWKFDIFMAEQGADAQSLTFLYKLVQGFGQMSYACEVAGLAGIRSQVLVRAKEIGSSLQLHGTVEKSQITLQREQQQAEKERRIVQAFIDFDVEAGDIEAFRGSLQQLVETAPATRSAAA